MTSQLSSVYPAANTNGSTVCNTPACAQTAAAIMKDVDLTLDPCSDFYQYTCGSWLKTATIPEDESSTGTFRVLQNDNYQILQQIFEGTYDDLLKKSNATEGFHLDDQGDLDRANFALVSDYYRSCMNLDIIDSLGPTPVYAELSQLLSKFIQENRRFITGEDRNILTETALFAYFKGVETLFSFSVVPDDKKPDTIVITLAQPDLILPSREYYEQPDVLAIFREGLVDIFMHIVGAGNGTDSDPIRAQKASQENLHLYSRDEITGMVNRFVDFETKLANATVKREDMQDPIALYNVMSLADIQQKYDFLDWERFLRFWVPESSPLPKNLIVATPSYFDKLSQWFRQDVSTENIREFILIRHVMAKIHALDTTSRQLQQTMSSKIASGTSVMRPRSQICTRNTASTFGQLVGRFYVMADFGGEKEREGLLVFLDRIHDAWLNRLPEMEWLDSETRAKAVEKVNKIKHKVGYNINSPDLRSPQSLRDFYGSVKISPTSFFENQESTTLWSLRRGWGKYGKPTDRFEWFMSPQEVNAYYSPNYNEIVVPAGILHTTFYDFHAPDYLNYGSIGMIIGHELTHAFDNSGRMYDGNGALQQWWTNATSKAFEEKTKCFIDQYNNFTIKGADNKEYHVNGKMTLGENLADNGGLSAAFIAYQELTKSSDMSNVRLPGLDQLSPEALFFINFGRTWCSLERPQMAVQQIFVDVHSPNRVRVNGVIQNSDDFAKVFQCPAGTPMNPSNKCRVW
ncbi:uncharacterized protein BYT42DRAFT_508673 [Radiomyces spectabilis]|uniref:uncharacterized protein n=1 Tax=Radiomyces spectabilis TaxID=64574 RepID=UPI002220A3DF|nr:uncharacterized protein BYT42DRAFT_508673 [Radiomyces spectabilis]KAI8390970.1 hypothetical protein BYT42DRAFT_508673 [Radiomyces spectabilis]